MSRFEWDRESKIMLYGQQDYYYGNVLMKPEINHGNSTRLYHADEIDAIMRERGMNVIQSFGRFDGTPASELEMQMLVYSMRTKNYEITDTH